MNLGTLVKKLMLSAGSSVFYYFQFILLAVVFWSDKTCINTMIVVYFCPHSICVSVF